MCFLSHNLPSTPVGEGIVFEIDVGGGKGSILQNPDFEEIFENGRPPISDQAHIFQKFKWSKKLSNFQRLTPTTLRADPKNANEDTF